MAEQDPHALPLALDAWGEAVARLPDEREHVAFDALRAPLREALRKRLGRPAPAGLAEATPGVEAAQRLARAGADLVEACDGFLRREAIAASITPAERRELLRGMVLTRATDNRLKAFFTGSEVQYKGVGFQGKGFRSLGQEAIFGAPLRLRRGAAHRAADGSWRGDVIAPMIRDLGAVLAMRPGAETVRMVLSAQMGKAGPPMDGRDLHVGDFGWGIVPASAPLGSSALAIAGIAMAFAREDSGRVAVSLIGEGATSLGEWHEAINLCATHRLPAVFCVQNNQTALSTPVAHQSAARVFADKAAGYGIPGITLDGTDPEAVAAALAWSAERARAGRGPTLVELVAMRMCGHAHHDDMLYLGKDPAPSWSYPPLSEPGYADPLAYAFWSARDPITTYARRLVAEGTIAEADLLAWQREADATVEAEARRVIEAPWPEGSVVGVGVLAGEPPRHHVEVLEKRDAARAGELPPLDPGPPMDPRGRTFLDAVTMGVG
ncbi:MAG TPA: thiamine pyrophosphate-dependent dehydrogenase E1 component subunit alpha, partial [Vicinamibacteria bacterium]|nr:thiamine pyrophosphate-dependent dehydrogenase E1 component subunit alpha [Vicinamibacteria bacterium]